MEIRWTAEHGRILMDFIKMLEKENIRYFVLRGFEGLPDNNFSKDVDIMVEPRCEKRAYKLLLEAFRKAGLTRCHSAQFGHAHCYIAMCIEKEFSIHIDLIEGYVSKGYEVVTFQEMYAHVQDYNGIKVLDAYMNGVMLLIYKIFGYRKAKLKDSYKKDIVLAYNSQPEQFSNYLRGIAGDILAKRLTDAITIGDFDQIVGLEPEFTKKIKHYTFYRHPWKTAWYRCQFLWQKASRIIFHYKKYAKTFAVLAPDGTGKTTFLKQLEDDLNFFFVNNESDGRIQEYHFRPNLLPNLGAVGEKAGVMKQDTNFTDPHRGKPANPLSSLIRCGYYTLDYIVGWQKCIRRDVHHDKISVFDRYSYDFIVDPRRTKLNLPLWVRKFFVALTPKPKVVFVLDASPEVIYQRKQELTMEEIMRQRGEYLKLAKGDKRFHVISAEKTPGEMAKEAVDILLAEFAKSIVCDS